MMLVAVAFTLSDVASAAPSAGACAVHLEFRERLSMLAMSGNGQLPKHSPLTTTTVVQDLDEVDAYHHQTGHAAILNLEPHLFHSMQESSIPLAAGKALRDDWQNRLVNLTERHGLRDRVESRRSVKGFLLGQDLVWNNISVSNISAVAHWIKSSFTHSEGGKSNIVVMYSEHPDLLWTRRNVNGLPVEEYTFIPDGVDYLASSAANDSAQQKQGPQSSRWVAQNFLEQLIPERSSAKVLASFDVLGGQKLDDLDLAARIEDLASWINSGDAKFGGAMQFPQEPEEAIYPNAHRCFNEFMKSLGDETEQHHHAEEHHDTSNEEHPSPRRRRRIVQQG